MIGQYGLFAVLVAVLLNGVADGKPPQKIIGGKPAALGDIPYIVSLRLRGQHVCGGSIIGERHILTAAHCVAGLLTRPYTDLLVVTGTISSRTGQTHVVKSILYHAQYNTQVPISHNDLAIISLHVPIKFNQNQKKLNLPSSATPSGVTATASGWGFTSAHSQVIVDGLLKIQVTTLTSAECQKYLTRVSVLHDHQICTKDSPGIGICQGDSGGPLVQNGQLIGVVSYCVPCGLGYPDVYTSVYHHLDWIKRFMASS